MTNSASSASENRRRGAYLFWGFLFGIGISALLDASDSFSVDVLFPEVFGIVTTVGVLGWLANRRAQRDLEAQLLRRIRSSVRDVAVAAIEELRYLGYFDRDRNTFKGMNLSGAKWTEAALGGANLEGVDLTGADLQRANLVFANLAGANLLWVNLQRADLWGASLRDAVMVEASLQGAQLTGANLTEANLRSANLQRAALMIANLQRAELVGTALQGASLMEADLQGAELAGAEFDETTRLPDGSKWKPGTDLARFTDPDHPSFWRSNQPRSPAYQGDSRQDIE